MRQNYLTIKAPGSATLEINKSLFISHVARTENEAQALDFALAIRRQYPDASHNCFACVAGPQDDFQKADDAGEPNGTAGKPMLEVIKKSKLCDTAIVVTRYFGGIKLGGGGLIRAYGKSASEAVRAAGIVERRLQSRIGIDIAYSFLGPMENQLRQGNYPLVGKEFTELIRLLVLVEAGCEPQLKRLASDITAGTACFSEQGFAYLEKDIDRPE